MKILLQHKKTGLYFQLPDGWTQDIDAATDFRTSQAALDFIRSECLPDAQITAVFVSDSYVESVSYQVHTPAIRARVRS
ncbi:MAG TPA: hypothetical protein VK327_07610 [Candidatus Paceibacterota bacterium]|nr:hypothetical protein [Candidatus Paceibacterota bacterium]